MRWPWQRRPATPDWDSFRERFKRMDAERRMHRSPLTLRQLEVLLLAAEGFSNQEIADQLGVALATVKYHLSGVYVRLGVKNRTGAIYKARELGVIA